MKSEKQTKAHLSPAEIEQFRKILLLRRHQLMGNVTSMEDEVLKKERTDLSTMPIHIADAGSDTYETDKNIGLMDSERGLLREVDAALNRIDEGTYGICEGSNKPIPKPRLKAIPWARYTVEYAEMMEKGQVRFGEE